MSWWLLLGGSLAAITVAGYYLSRYGDAIADKAGLSRNWVGLALIAAVTSLPELATGVSAVTVAGVPDIAVGDVLGSCVFNLLILVIVDFLYRKEPVYTRARRGHILSAGFGAALIGFVGFNLIVYREAAAPTIGGVGLYAPLIVLLYAFAVRALFLFERAQLEQLVEEEHTYPHLTLEQAIRRYAVAAVFVVAVGISLPFIGERIAEQMGWSHSFVGTLLVAGATSAPEIAVTVAALRLGALDMAIGGLLGSNLFNLVVLAIDDLLYTGGPLFAEVSSAHAASAFTAVMMSGIAIIGLMLRPRSRVFHTVSRISLLLLAVYLLNVTFLYLYAR